MSRKPPARPPAVTLAPNANAIEQVRSYKIITPLYGGGAETDAADAVTIVRGSSIRGQLRYWWRATRGGAFSGDWRKMKEKEDVIWGAAATIGGPGQSQVKISVEIRNPGTDFVATNTWGETVTRRGQKIEVGDIASQDSYAAFPLRDKPGAKVLEDVAFDLHISYPAQLAPDVNAALWAWETFGGIGARTRRGFGALASTQIDGETVARPKAQQLWQSIQRGLTEHTATGQQWPESVPNVGPDCRYKTSSPGSKPDTMEAWRHLISKLRRFRQMRHPGTERNRPGTSKWPEANSIRRKTNQNSNRHQPRGDVPEAYPRGQLGLPIVFQFKDRGDPDQVILKGKDHDRLSSPLILRPILCADGIAAGLALVLAGPTEPPGGLVLETNRGNQPVNGTVTAAEAARIEPLDGNPDVLQAFLDTL